MIGTGGILVTGGMEGRGGQRRHVTADAAEEVWRVTGSNSYKPPPPITSNEKILHSLQIMNVLRINSAVFLVNQIVKPFKKPPLSKIQRPIKNTPSMVRGALPKKDVKNKSFLSGVVGALLLR